MLRNFVPTQTLFKNWLRVVQAHAVLCYRQNWQKCHSSPFYWIDAGPRLHKRGQHSLSLSGSSNALTVAGTIHYIHFFIQNLNNYFYFCTVYHTFSITSTCTLAQVHTHMRIRMHTHTHARCTHTRIHTHMHTRNIYKRLRDYIRMHK